MNIKNTFLALAPWLGSGTQRGDPRGSQRKALGFQSCQGLAGAEEETGGRPWALERTGFSGRGPWALERTGFSGRGPWALLHGMEYPGRQDGDADGEPGACLPGQGPLLQFSHSVVSDSLRPHGSQHDRPPCPSPTPGVHSNSCPSSR